RPVRRGGAYGDDALSRTVLRFSPPPRHGAGALSGGLRAAGLGLCGTIRAAASLPGIGAGCRPPRNPLSQSATAEIHGRGPDQRSEAGQCQREFAPAPPRVTYRGGDCVPEGRHRHQNYAVERRYKRQLLLLLGATAKTALT